MNAKKKLGIKTGDTVVVITGKQAPKLVDGKPQAAFTFFLGGNSRQGQEAMGRELGVMLEERIPAFLVELGQTVAASGMDFDAWRQADPDGVERVAAPYLA